MIRAVFDTNLLVSYLLTHRPPIATLIDQHLAQEGFGLVTTPGLLQELDRVLRYPKLQRYYSEAERTRFVALLMVLAEVVDFMARGITYSDVITTVSPTYAREIQTPEFGCGLNGVLTSRRDDLVGILNGVDTKVWHPAVEVGQAVPENGLLGWVTDYFGDRIAEVREATRSDPICARNIPCVYTTPFGGPVVPEVKRTAAGSSRPAPMRPCCRARTRTGASPPCRPPRSGCSRRNGKSCRSYGSPPPWRCC